MIFSSSLARSKPVTLSSLYRLCSSSSSNAATTSASAAVTAKADIKSDETIEKLMDGRLSHYQLESALGDNKLAVDARRLFISSKLSSHSQKHALENNPRQINDAHLPSTGQHFNEHAFYNKIHGANCENVVGFIPIPVGVVGPLKVDTEDFYVPLATTEGALLASVNRGARALSMSMENGVRASILRDGMTRSPVLRFPSAAQAVKFAKEMESPEKLSELSAIFSTTTRFGKLKSVTANVAGRMIYLRFLCSTGDAMGMNMVGKGVNEIIQKLIKKTPGLELVALSGNFCEFSFFSFVIVHI